MGGYWTKTLEQALKETRTTQSGLSAQEAQRRLLSDGPNTLGSDDKYKLLKIFWSNTNSLLVYVMIGAAIISYYLKEILEFYVIMLIVIATVGLGVLQEYGAERTIRALSKYAQQYTSVLRDGKETRVPSLELVVGDIIVLTKGTIVPADARVIVAEGIICDESILTGESVGKSKSARKISGVDIPLADQDNMVFSGTSISAGKGLAVVVSTGTRTQIGMISDKLRQLGDQKSPLQRKVDTMGKNISAVIIVCCALILILLLLADVPLGISLIIVSAVAVAGIPESFPLAMTVSLSVGVKRMVKHKALVKNLSSVETLGTTTVICTDKTGTLTQNKMRVTRIQFADGTTLRVDGTAYDPSHIFVAAHGKSVNNTLSKYSMFFSTAILCNDSNVVRSEEQWMLQGEPTEGALLAMAKSAQYNDVEMRSRKRIFELPFSSDTKYMIAGYASTKQGNHGATAYMKGAVERVLSRCTHYRVSPNKIVRMNASFRRKSHAFIEESAKDGYRILGLATKKTERFKGKISADGFVFEGMVAIEDPLRPEAFEAVRKCKAAGIRIIMITGDHQFTAQKIAASVGILGAEDIVMDGSRIDTMSDEQLDSAIGRVAVFARATPDHKFRIVSSLQRRGEIVAMTGDGVNDALALKKADIGVAMGKNGTEVAREAADLVLLDDNFSTIVQAVAEGRTIYSNIRRFVYYLLTSNFALVALMLAAVMMGYAHALPLTALMILFINVVTNTFPALALSVEPTHKDVMAQRPRDPKESIFNTSLLVKTSFAAAIIFAVTGGIFLWEKFFANHGAAATMAFATMVIATLFHTFNARRLHGTCFDKDFFSNHYAFYSVVGSFGLLWLVIHSAWGNRVFDTVPLTQESWAVVILLGAVIIVVLEIVKLLVRLEIGERDRYARQ